MNLSKTARGQKSSLMFEAFRDRTSSCAVGFGDFAKTLPKHNSCTQTTIIFVCWRSPSMKYEDGVAAPQ